jgi:hypothetical protein
MRKLLVAATTATTLMVTACAGRAPAPVQTVQMKDNTMDCSAINAEIAANTAHEGELGSEKGGKVAQNVVAGVAGVFIPVLWLAMDFQGAADTETRALEARNQYLSTLAVQRCPTQQQVATPPQQVATQQQVVTH